MPTFLLDAFALPPFVVKGFFDVVVALFVAASVFAAAVAATDEGDGGGPVRALDCCNQRLSAVLEELLVPPLLEEGRTPGRKYPDEILELVGD